MTNKTYAAELFHGMTFQQIHFKLNANGLWWNPIIITLLIFDGLNTGWTWINYFLVGLFALRFVVSFFMAGWIAKQPADRNIPVGVRR